MFRHNKKRNTGLVYEFFARGISQAIIEGRDSDIAKAKALLRKHFNKSTDLYKELKLTQTLHETRVASREMAIGLINRVREVVKIQSQQRLELEKTSLIHEINTTFGPQFFDQTIENYKTYATIQLLLNNWRSVELQENLSSAVELEERLVEHLVSGRDPATLQNVTDMTTDDVDRLVVNIMTEKVNSKFIDLDVDQKRIIQLYVFADDHEAKKQLIEELTTLRSKTLRLIETTGREFDGVLQKKLQEVKALMLTEHVNTSFLTDELVTFYLGVTRLERELGHDEAS